MSWSGGSSKASSSSLALTAFTHKDLLFRATGERGSVEVAISLNNAETGIFEQPIDIGGEILSQLVVYGRQRRTGLARFAQAPVDREDPCVGIIGEVLAELERPPAIVRDGKHETIVLPRTQVSQIRLVDIERENTTWREELARGRECCGEALFVQ